MESPPRTCPKCGIISPPNAPVCDCGHSFLNNPDQESQFDFMHGVQLFRWGMWLALLSGAVLILATIGVVGVSWIVLGLGVVTMLIGYAKSRR